MATFYITAVLRDAYGRRTRKTFELSVADYAGALARQTTLLAALANMCEAEIVSSKVWSEAAYTDAVDAGANIDEGVTFSCDLGGGKSAALKIPSPVNSILNTDGTVDMTDGIVTALETEFLSGEVLISDGETVLDFTSGKLDK